MKVIKQLSVFAENKPGKLEKITGIIAREKVNILAVNIAGMGDFGVLKFVVDKPEIAHDKLKEKGFTVTMNDLLGIEMTDRPGGLHSVAKTLRENGVNIDNAYVLIPESRRKAFLLIETKNLEKARAIKGL